MLTVKVLKMAYTVFSSNEEKQPTTQAIHPPLSLTSAIGMLASIHGRRMVSLAQTKKYLDLALSLSSFKLPKVVNGREPFWMLPVWGYPSSSATSFKQSFSAKSPLLRIWPNGITGIGHSSNALLIKCWVFLRLPTRPLPRGNMECFFPPYRVTNIDVKIWLFLKSHVWSHYTWCIFHSGEKQFQILSSWFQFFTLQFK